jgi:hypothetical protein
MISGRAHDSFARTRSTVIRALHSKRSALREGQQVCIQLVGVRERQSVCRTLVDLQVTAGYEWRCLAWCPLDWRQTVVAAMYEQGRYRDLSQFRTKVGFRVHFDKLHLVAENLGVPVVPSRLACSTRIQNSVPFSPSHQLLAAKVAHRDRYRCAASASPRTVALPQWSASPPTALLVT